jgi:sugar lactone lactonase YvrE
MSFGNPLKQILSASIVAIALLGIAAPAQGASGTWDRAYGQDVNGGGVFGICTVAAICQVGQNTAQLGGDMWNPSGVAVDSGGNLYVADSGYGRIQKFDSAGNFQRTWGGGVNGGSGLEVCTVAANCEGGSPGGTAGEMFQPGGVAIDSGGNVYVADFNNNRIEKFSSSGVFERTWGKGVDATNPGNLCTLASGDTCQAGTTGVLGGEMNNPFGIATDSSGNVYVGDGGNNRIQVFDTAGTFERAWGKDVAASGPGNTGTGFEVCNPTNGDVCQTGSSTTAKGGEMHTPEGVATDGSGNVYVADALNDRVQVFSSTGTFIRAWGVGVNGGGAFGVCTVAANCAIGSSGGLGGEMFFPIALTADSSGNVYVADYANDRVQKFSSSGTWDRAWGKGVNGGTAYGVCTAAASCQVGTSGGLGGEMDTPDGVTTDSAGDLYVADYQNNRIQKFVDPPPPPPSATPSPGPNPSPAKKKKCKKSKKRAAVAKKCKKAKK